MPEDALVTELLDVGYVVVRRVLSPADVARLRAAFPESPASTTHVDVDDDTAHADLWRSLPSRPPVAGLIERLVGVGEVRLHGREPGRGGGGQGLHADRPAGRLTGDPSLPDGLTLLWMLDPFTVDNGATRVVPCSHRGSASVPKHLAQPSVVHPDEVVVVGEAGDVLVLDPHLWHSGRTNTSGERRRSVQMSVTRSRSRP